MTVHRLWKYKLRDGATAEAAIWHDRSEEEATLEVTVADGGGVEERLAARLGEAVSDALRERGAQMVYVTKEAGQYDRPIIEGELSDET
jgi:hypothetical protein